MGPRPTAREPDDPPTRRARPATTGLQRGASGEGSRSALERLIEQEQAKRRAQAYDEPEVPDELRGPRP